MPSKITVEIDLNESWDEYADCAPALLIADLFPEDKLMDGVTDIRLIDYKTLP